VGPIVGTLAGLAAGLLAPYVSQRAQSLATTRRSQAALAQAALSLFEGNQSLEELLCGPTSPTRRRLFLLTTQLRDNSARAACMRLIATAGTSDMDAGTLTDEWARCIDELGRIVRSG
jgi:hypothetical protein